MARKRKNSALGILLILGLPVLFANWLHDKLGMPMWLTYTLLISIAVAAFFVYFAEQNRKFRAIQIANIDSMTGIDFERYLQKLLTTQGYSVSMTQAKSDCMRLAHQDCHPERSEGSRREILRYAQNDTPDGVTL